MKCSLGGQKWPTEIRAALRLSPPSSQASGSTPTILRSSSAHGSQYSPGARPADGLPVGGESESLGSS